MPLLYPALQHSTLDWEFETEPSNKYCLAMPDGVCSWPRGKVLGGCSTINAMMYVRGNRRDYDEWARLGNPGWNYDAVLPYFKYAREFSIIIIQLLDNNIFSFEFSENPKTCEYHNIKAVISMALVAI